LSKTLLAFAGLRGGSLETLSIFTCLGSEANIKKVGQNTIISKDKQPRHVEILYYEKFSVYPIFFHGELSDYTAKLSSRETSFSPEEEA
jgi:hypothetical protein